LIEEVGGKGELVLLTDNKRNEAIRLEMHNKAVKETGFGSNHSPPELLR
jgi:hypothetical protein